MTYAARLRCLIYTTIAAVENRTVIHFLHIGKTGGTAIKHALRGNLAKGDSRILFHDHAFLLDMVPRRDRMVFFLRDPISRFVSGFNSRRRKGQPRYYFEWSKGEAAAFSEFGSPNELACALHDQDEARRTRAAQAMREIQHVRDSYAELFGGLQGILDHQERIQLVGFHEAMYMSFESLKEIFGLPTFLTLPSDDVLSHRSPSTADRLLTAPGQENLRNWYAEDYRIYDHLKAAWWPRITSLKCAAGAGASGERYG